MNELSPGGFRHYTQSLRVVECLERDGRGLNLTFEVRDGIVKHSKGKGKIITDNPDKVAVTLEGRIVRLSDIIAYENHDLDDAQRAGVIKEKDIPRDIVKVLGDRYSRRINTMVTDVIEETLKKDDFNIFISDRVYEAIENLRKFLYDNVYDTSLVHQEFTKCAKILKDLYSYYSNTPEVFDRESNFLRLQDPLERRVCDFLAGMTDRYAISRWEEIFMPRPWSVL